MKTAMYTALLILFAALGCRSQDSKVLTPQEQLELRNAQVDYLQTQTALQTAYGNSTAAANKLSTMVAEVYKSHKVDDKEYLLCDGPGAPPLATCTGLKPQELALRKKAKEPEKKAEAKPAAAPVEKKN